jgi:hypothetical protein
MNTPVRMTAYERARLVLPPTYGLLAPSEFWWDLFDRPFTIANSDIRIRVEAIYRRLGTSEIVIESEPLNADQTAQLSKLAYDLGYYSEGNNG